MIVATFHTHPNTGNNFEQEPSPGDCRAIAEDPDLKPPEYQGEIVISQNLLYFINPSGFVTGAVNATLLSEKENND